MERTFAAILRGETPCDKVYEDEHVFAFLDGSPLAGGHTLVVPKEAAQTLGDLSDDAAAALGRVLPRLCRAIVAATGNEDYNILQNNGELAHQSIAQVHFHIIPKTAFETGLGIQWPAVEQSAQSAKDTAARITEALEKDRTSPT